MIINRSSFLTQIFTYYPLCLTIISTILNSLILIIFLRKKFRQRPFSYYIRFIAFIDILILYGWNLDNFFRLKYYFELEKLTILTCKLLSYYNNVVNQSSAWLRVLMCADRFYTLNQIQQRQRIDRNRCILLLIIFTLILIGLVNLHLPIFACYKHLNHTEINIDSIYYQIYPMWHYVNLILYNILPFILMLLFNIRIIRHLILLKQTTTITKTRIQHRSISISIFLSAFLFCLMTTPATIIFAFFHTQIRSEIFENFLLSFFDSIQSTYHSLSFFLYFITLVEFRKEFYRLIYCHHSMTNKRLINITIIGGAANRYKTKSTPTGRITD